jgi:hypothetical protein
LAAELAEVYALGRTMWMLLDQTPSTYDHVAHRDDVHVTWTDDLLPIHWMHVVDQCMDRDPNKRPRAANLAEFWSAQADYALHFAVTM